MNRLKCILLVDDDETDNFFHSNRIEKAGVCERIEIATDGQKALEYLKKAKTNPETYPLPDMIYLDINMPKVNGFEFLEEFNKFDEKVKTKVIIIMLSTSINPDEIKKALIYKEVREFQNKPLSIDSVKQTVKRYFSP